MYLAISHISASTVLLKEEEGEQKPIFFTSMTFSYLETRYSTAEKLFLALTQEKEELRRYLESRHIIVRTSYPLKAILSMLGILGRNSKASMSLGTFDIQYKPRTSKTSKFSHIFFSNVNLQLRINLCKSYQ